MRLPARDRRRSAAAPVAPSLLERVGEAFRAQGVPCCQWKGHWKRARWESGAGDLDLLVPSSAAGQVEGILSHLGFKPALPPREAGTPGTANWFGYDAQRETLVHLHVHSRLILGGYWATRYHLPIERAILETAVAQTPFPVPAPELEFIVFVLRTLQRSTLRDVLRVGLPRWLSDAQPEYTYLLGRVDRRRLEARLRELVPAVDIAFFDACARALRSAGWAGWRRWRLRRALDARLWAHAYPPPAALLAWRIGRRLRLLPRLPRMRMARGGLVFALVGADGAGKSTCVAALRGWLGDSFEMMTAHLGRPPRSLTTLAVGGLLKVERTLRRWLRPRGEANELGTLELLRLVCTARDRHRLFAKARRFAAAGGFALCERYPIPQNRLLVGPEIARLLGPGRDTPLARRLMRAEQRFYDRITPPDVVAVLLVDPEVAVRRKVTEPSDYVRARARIVWETDWASMAAHVVDAGRPLPQVVADLKALVWSEV